jgi:alpha-glucosidase (family GH31 glycosyl hydrolase)
MFGEDLLIAPIYQDTVSKSITLPPGQWRYFFKDQDVVEGDQTIIRDFALNEYPVYIRDGAIIPMNIKRSYTGLGDESYSNYMTILIYPSAENRFRVYNPDRSGVTEVQVIQKRDRGELHINLTGKKISHILCIFSTNKPSLVELDGDLLMESEYWEYDVENNKLIIRTDEYRQGEYVIM